MLRIAMVEDDAAYAQLLIRYCERYEQEKNERITTEWFENPFTFLEKYTGGYDVVLMDIVMPLMDGMTCAGKLRAMDDTVILCFVTSMAQFAIHGYEVGAADFVIKPVQYEEFALKLDRFLRMLKRSSSPSIMLNSHNTIKKLDLRDLYYVEVYNHSLIWHTADGNWETYGKLASLEEDERFSQFLRVSQSHLVNCRHIASVSDDTVVVGGSQVPVSRRRRKECLEKLARILGGSAGA